MRPTTEEVIARHRAWLAKQGLPIRERDPAHAAAAPAVQEPAAPAPAPVATPRPSRPRPVEQETRQAETMSPAQREWLFLCQRKGTPIYDQAQRLLRERSLT